MTQQELAQLKVLLGKAKEALPEVDEFFVYEENGEFTLRGDRTFVHNGSRITHTLLPNGERTENRQVIY